MNINNSYNIEVLKTSKAKIAVLITAHNSLHTIVKTLQSLANQTNCSDYIVLISDDFSNDCLDNELNYILQYLKIIYFKVHFKSVHKNRNFLLNLIYTYAYHIEVIIRCDADDMFHNNYVFQNIEKSFFSSSTIRKKCNFLLSSNTLYSNGKYTNKINFATNTLKNNKYLLNRLFLMAQDKPEYELPSCNFVFKKSYKLLYPKITSAEDHFMLVQALIQYKNDNFRIDEDFISIDYSLSGTLTFENRKNEYLMRRKNLYNFAYKRIIRGSR